MAIMTLAGGLLAGTQSASAAVPATSGDVAIAPTGNGFATPRFIDQRTNPPAAETERQVVPATLGTDGKPTGSNLPISTKQGSKPARSAAVGEANSGAAPPRVDIPVPTTVNCSFDGINQAAGGGAQPPDVNASIGRTQILEPVNQRVSVYGKCGGQQCTNTLAGWLGLGATVVFDPRTLYDNLNDRFILVATTFGTPGAAPRMFLAASATGNACGGWIVYVLTFGGGLYPPGALLDYPMLGQDRQAILVSTNNFNPGYINTAAWGVSKALVYAAAGVAFPAFGVSPSTEPVTVTGIPIGVTANTFWLASVPNVGYNLFRMTNSAGPGTTMVLQATINSFWTPPLRRVLQCGVGNPTLDPLDGRIQWAPVQAVNSQFIWFTHGFDIAGFPSVRYGAIDTVFNTATVNNVFHSLTSDDFNPSIGAFEVAPNAFNIWLNWAYTDIGAVPCRNTSNSFDGVLPGGGVPPLTGTDLTLVIGSLTANNSRFGDYSSVHVDPIAASPTCPPGGTALLAQQYFDPAGWRTRLSRVSIGPGC
jgi:hypothetical protein